MEMSCELNSSHEKREKEGKGSENAFGARAQRIVDLSKLRMADPSAKSQTASVKLKVISVGVCHALWGMSAILSCKVHSG